VGGGARRGDRSPATRWATQPFITCRARVAACCAQCLHDVHAHFESHAHSPPPHAHTSPAQCLQPDSASRAFWPPWHEVQVQSLAHWHEASVQAHAPVLHAHGMVLLLWVRGVVRCVWGGAEWGVGGGVLLTS
jgi:hypothetical protein